MTELAKQQNEAKHSYDKSKVAYDITKSKVENYEIMQMQKAYLDEQMHNIERDIADENDQNSKLSKLKELHRLQNESDTLKMNNLKLKNDIDSNDLNNDLERIRAEITVIQSQNTAYLNRMTSEEYQNPVAYLLKAYADKLELEDHTALIKQVFKLANRIYLQTYLVKIIFTINYSKIFIERQFSFF